MSNHFADNLEYSKDLLAFFAVYYAHKTLHFLKLHCIFLDVQRNPNFLRVLILPVWVVALHLSQARGIHVAQQRSPYAVAQTMDEVVEFTIFVVFFWVENDLKEFFGSSVCKPQWESGKLLVAWMPIGDQMGQLYIYDEASVRLWHRRYLYSRLSRSCDSELPPAEGAAGRSAEKEENELESRL